MMPDKAKREPSSSSDDIDTEMPVAMESSTFGDSSLSFCTISDWDSDKVKAFFLKTHGGVFAKLYEDKFSGLAGLDICYHAEEILNRMPLEQKQHYSTTIRKFMPVFLKALDHDGVFFKEYVNPQK